MTTQFEIGKTYRTRSIGDYDCVFSFTVVARTAKMVTLQSNMFSSGTKARKVFIDGDVKHCNPLGVYSMSPVIRANRETV